MDNRIPIYDEEGNELDYIPSDEDGILEEFLTVDYNGLYTSTHFVFHAFTPAEKAKYIAEKQEAAIREALPSDVADLTDAMVEIAELTADLEDAIVELAELIGGAE